MTRESLTGLQTFLVADEGSETKRKRNYTHKSHKDIHTINTNQTHHFNLEPLFNIPVRHLSLCSACLESSPTVLLSGTVVEESWLGLSLQLQTWSTWNSWRTPVKRKKEIKHMSCQTPLMRSRNWISEKIQMFPPPLSSGVIFCQTFPICRRWNIWNFWPRQHASETFFLLWFFFFCWVLNESKHLLQMQLQVKVEHQSWSPPVFSSGWFQKRLKLQIKNCNWFYQLILYSI